MHNPMNTKFLIGIAAVVSLIAAACSTSEPEPKQDTPPLIEQEQVEQVEQQEVAEPIQEQQVQEQEAVVEQEAQQEFTSVILTPLSEYYEHPNGNSFKTIVTLNEFDDSLQSFLVVEGDRSYRLNGDPVVMAVRCLKNRLDVAFFNLPYASDNYRVTTRFDSQPSYTVSWVAEEGGWAGVRNHHTFLNKIKDHDELTIKFEGYRDDVTSTFRLRGLFDTPVQPNLDKCGSY